MAHHHPATAIAMHQAELAHPRPGADALGSKVPVGRIDLHLGWRLLELHRAHGAGVVAQQNGSGITG